jgi:hypothetical protein
VRIKTELMKINFLFFVFFCGAFAFLSCNRGEDGSANLVTKRIQYDVIIKTPDPDFDWWMQNIEGSEREKLVHDMIYAAINGKVKAYGVLSNKLLTTDDIKGMLRHVDSVQVENPDPPHQMIDTVVIHEVNLKEITKIRFLEEWKMDQNSLVFSKKVLGICPMVEAYMETGELKGYKPLFWVFFDSDYPGEFDLKK